MYIVILFFFCILFQSSLGCDPCEIAFGDYATCSGEDVCPLYATSVTVQCFITNITTLVFIEQLRIQGNCGSVSQYTHFCREVPIKEIVMLDSDEKNHRCSADPTTTPTPPMYSSTKTSTRQHDRSTITHEIHTDSHTVTNSSKLQTIIYDITTLKTTTLISDTSSRSIQTTTLLITSTLDITSNKPSRHSTQTTPTADISQPETSTDRPDPPISTDGARQTKSTSNTTAVTSTAARTTTKSSDKIQQAFDLGASALALVLVVILGWALRALLRRLGVGCRSPLNRTPQDRPLGKRAGGTASTKMHYKANTQSCKFVDEEQTSVMGVGDSVADHTRTKQDLTNVEMQDIISH